MQTPLKLYSVVHPAGGVRVGLVPENGAPADCVHAMIVTSLVVVPEGRLIEQEELLTFELLDELRNAIAISSPAPPQRGDTWRRQSCRPGRSSRPCSRSCSRSRS